MEGCIDVSSICPLSRLDHRKPQQDVYAPVRCRHVASDMVVAVVNQREGWHVPVSGEGERYAPVCRPYSPGAKHCCNAADSIRGTWSGLTGIMGQHAHRNAGSHSSSECI